MNKAGEVRYDRTLRCSHLAKESGSPQFIYCKIENPDALKALLKSHGISLNAEAVNGSTGQRANTQVHDHKFKESSQIQQNMSGRRLVWFRTLAFQANDHGFESRRPHSNSSLVLSISFPTKQHFPTSNTAIVKNAFKYTFVVVVPQSNTFNFCLVRFL